MANQPYTDKTEISRADYSKLTGLMELARRNIQQNSEITAAASEIVGEKGDGKQYFGHAADECVKTNPNADSLLFRLAIKVVP